MRNNNINISKIEKIAVNSCSPLTYIFTFGKIPFNEIIETKEKNYKKLVKYLDHNKKIPLKVKTLYHLTICGNISLATAYIRKYYHDNFN